MTDKERLLSMFEVRDLEIRLREQKERNVHAAFYMRLEKNEEKTDESFENIKTDLEMNHPNLVIDKCYFDHERDYSGLEEMLAAARSKAFDMVICPSVFYFFLDTDKDIDFLNRLLYSRVNIFFEQEMLFLKPQGDDTNMLSTVQWELQREVARQRPSNDIIVKREWFRKVRSSAQYKKN